MSGPKTSHLNLTPEQREALRQQQLARAELAVLQKQLKNIHAVVVQADSILEKFQPIWEETQDQEALNNAKELRRQAMEALNEASAMTEEAGLPALQETNRQIRDMQNYLTAVTRKLDTDFGSALDTFRGKSDEKVSRGFHLDFSSIIPKKSENPMLERILAELDALSCLNLTEDHRKELAAIRERATRISDQTFLKNFYAVTVTPYISACVRYQENWDRYGAEYQQKLLRLEENLRILGIEIPEIPFSENAVTDLDERIQQTDEIILYREEQAYISRCVDEAMQEMGYNLLGSRDITRRSGKKFHNELYLFDEGTAVNVTYSGDGQISMELGGICREDRLPSNAESLSLTEDMHAFCGDYSELEKRLKEKGIASLRISTLPADPQYAQMINISDYQLIAEPEEFQIRQKKQHSSKIRQKKAGED